MKLSVYNYVQYYYIIQISPIKILIHQRSYLEKFLVVHMLIAVNIKHFESYMKSCTRLCNSNTLSVI